MAKPRQDSSATRIGKSPPGKNPGKQHQCPKPACLSDLCSGQAHPDGAGAGRLWELRMRLPQGHVVWKVAILYGRALLRQKARTSAQQSGVKSRESDFSNPRGSKPGIRQWFLATLGEDICKAEWLQQRQSSDPSTGSGFRLRAPAALVLSLP